MKNIVLVISGILLTGCSSFLKHEGDIKTYNCQSGYVKHLKYDTEEITVFKQNRNKNAFYIKNEKDSFEKCDSYPCQICNKFLCKQHNFKDVKVFDNEENKYFKLKSLKSTKYNDNFLKLFKNKKIETDSDFDYIWNIFVKDNIEYEQVFNQKNGKLVYEIITPYELNEQIVVSECDIQVYSIFNGFFYSYGY